MSEPDDERADEQRERAEERPASDVVAPGRARRADGLRRRRGRDAHPEREHTGTGSGRRSRSRASAPCSPAPARCPRHGATTTRPSPRHPWRHPRARLPSGASTRTAFGVMVTGPLKRSVTSVGAASRPETASPARARRASTCARAARDDECDGRRPRARPARASRPPRPKRPKMGAASRSANRRTASSTKVSANPAATPAGEGGAPDTAGRATRRRASSRSRGGGTPTREYSHGFGSCTRNGDTRDEESDAAATSDQRGLKSFPRTRASSTRTRDERRLRPDRVREEVHRRERREDRDDPQADARDDDDHREQVRAPGPAPEDLGPDDHLGDETSPRNSATAAASPVRDLSARDHASPRLEILDEPGATTNVKASPTSTTSSGGCTR